MKNKKRKAFTLIELIVVMAVIGILVLLATPKFVGYTERARETKHIHTAKVIETALEAYLINGGVFPDDLEVVDVTLLKEAANKETLIGVNGYVSTIDEEVYYELTYDFIKKLDVKLSAKNVLLIEANASSVPTAVYASEKGIALVDKEKPMKGYGLKPDDIPVGINPSDIKQISAGTNHTLALLNDGRVFGWGRNNEGQLGIGNKIDSHSPVEIKGLSKVRIIHASINSSFAILDDGKVMSWGQNMNGILANGNALNVLQPEYSKLSSVRKISIIGLHGLALLENGTVMSWGNGEYGQLGYESGKSVYNPTVIPGLYGVTDIETGEYSSYALMSDLSVKSWGMNSLGQLGLGDTVVRKTPTTIPGLTNIKKIKAGANNAFAIDSNNTLKSWGLGSSGELGLGTSSTKKSIPMIVPGIDSVNEIFFAGNHIFSINLDGEIYAWGQNNYSQLLNESPGALYVPTKVANPSCYEIVSVGQSRTYVRSLDGNILAVGLNNYGQLGDGTTEDKSTPTLIPLP